MQTYWEKMRLWKKNVEIKNKKLYIVKKYIVKKMEKKEIV